MAARRDVKAVAGTTSPGRVVVRWQEVRRGAVAAVAALAAMTGTAAAALLLVDAGEVAEFGRLTATVVAMAVGGSADVSAVPSGSMPVAVRGNLGVVPSGVALVGALVLGWLLLRHRDGLLVRGAAAAIAFPGGVAAIALAAKGTVTPPGGAAGGMSGVCGLPAIGPWGRGGPVDELSIGFSAPVGPAAIGWVPAVVGVCWLVRRFGIRLRGPLWTASGLAVAAVVLAGVLGGPAVAGGVLLLFPTVVLGVVALGLGLPWTVRTDGALACVLDGVAPPAHGGPLTWVAVAVVLGLGVVVALAGRSLVVCAGTAVALGVLAWWSRVSVRLGVDAFGFEVPVLDASWAVNPLAALALGCVVGLLANGVLRLVSVWSPAWKNRVG
ncbi:streptophobe family protein [Lentzea cavernae]|uniref:Uncharacterized protein n=1 Tax=Lentzea cavernae TaxID=2020703 RepID=A0ABQ3LYT3_9PSEU|nr:streptophobe family protein [Lentzea cavernae]GHH27759.1 hypothetical protein GCM10017774_00850 [Lentzea cavernae]